MLRPVHRYWLVAGAAAGALSFVVVHTQGRIAEQRAVLGSEQTENRRLAILRSENDRLESAQLSEPERRHLADTHAESASLRQRLDELERTALEGGDEKPRARQAKDWAFAGSRTPNATLESVLWAASRGDTERLSDLLAFAPELRTQADGLFSKLPRAAQEDYGTPEKVIATLVAGSFPKDAQASQVFGDLQYGEQDASITMSVTHADGESRINLFRLHNSGDGWKLLVPANVMMDLEQSLLGDQQQPPETSSP